MLTPYVRNPRTNAWILVDGPTYRKLTADERYAADATEQLFERRSRRPSKKASKQHRPSPAELKRIEAHPVAKNESLEETLRRTQQPALRAHLKKMQAGERRGSLTRGWSGRAPRAGRPRHILKAACGDAAFLMPEQEKFPIMRKCGSGYEMHACDCSIDCGGVQAAYIRARQWKYPHVAASASRILKSKCGHETAQMKRTDLMKRVPLRTLRAIYKEATGKSGAKLTRAQIEKVRAVTKARLAAALQ